MLATVVMTGGVNLSARMASDGEHTLSLMRRDLKMMRDLCLKCEGQVLKTTSEGLLLYFSSAVQAVTCALKIQVTLRAAATRFNPRDLLSHRIGIHLGDMVISETDARGNGVSIAAYLQSEAEAGGICVSQMVYDLVKHALPLQVNSLGMHELPFLQETVSIYQVVVQSSPESASTAPPETDQEQIYQTLIQELEYSPHLLRIKKLLICICKHTWESNPAQLANYQLDDLIQETIDWFPTLQDLKSSLEKIIKTLSKPAEYTFIANLIIRKLSRIYPDYQVPDNPLLDHPLVEQAVQMLEQDDDLIRIKKLLLCACRNVWENDPQQLRNAKLRDLIQEVLEVFATFSHLKVAFEQVLNTISKPTEYTLLVNAILTNLGPLYPDYAAPSVAHRGTNFTVAAEAEHIVAVATLGQELLSVTLPSLSPEQLKQQQIQLTSALFDLCAEIVRATNPLRAKILLFSVLHYPLGPLEQEWSIVKTHDLRELLTQLLTAFPVLADLEAQLEQTAGKLEEPEPLQQAASVIINCLRPLHSYWQPVPAPVQPIAASYAQVAYTQPVGFLQQPPPDEEITCQFA